MKRVLFAACMLAAPGLAAAQADEFTAIFNHDSSRVFPISGFGQIVGVEASLDRAVVPLAAGAQTVADGEVLLLFVEDDGVRMPEPEEQLSLD
jgi:hypothetical protein